MKKPEEEEPTAEAEKGARAPGGPSARPVVKVNGGENPRRQRVTGKHERGEGSRAMTKQQVALWRRAAGTPITFLGAEEGEAQGDVVVTLGVRALHVPADTFIHPAIVPNQEAVEQGNTGSGAGSGTCLREEPRPSLQRDDGSNHSH